jgi:gas vesicle protein/DnaJ-domain-containing protein 1
MVVTGELLATVIPRLARRDFKHLSLDRLEAFVLSQVDGQSSLDELATVSGMPLGKLRRIVLRLHELGAIEIPGRPVATQRLRPSSKPPRHRSTVPAPKSVRRTSMVPPAVRASAPPPRRIEGATVAKVAVDARDAFILAQIDGSTGVEDLAAVAGVSLKDLTRILTRLAEAGAVDLGQSTRPSERPRGGPPRVSSPPKATSVRPPKGSSPPSRPSRRSVPIREHDPSRGRPIVEAPGEEEPCDLDPALQARLDTMVAALSTATHYEVLSVKEDADKKTIKRAYYELAALLHPDRHFRKRLGRYKAKMNDVFVRITLACETLSDPLKRASYDRGLPPGRASAPGKVSAPAAAPPVPASPVPAVPAAPPVKISVAPPRSDPARRGVFAARLSRAPAADRGPQHPPSKLPSGDATAPASDPLRRFFATKVQETGRVRARVFVDAGNYALAKEDLVGAAQNYRLALQCHEDPEIRGALEAVEGKAAAQTFERAMREAIVAEKAERWDEAAQRYGKAYAAVPGAQVAERLANALRMQGSDLRRAVKMAEDAVLREPQNVVHHVTLGAACADAGLWTRARSEADRALALAPADAAAKALAARVKQNA